MSHSLCYPTHAHCHCMFQAFLGCLVRDVASFMIKLFDMAKQAVSNIINTVKGWIQRSIDWAVRKIQELWSGITGAHHVPLSYLRVSKQPCAHLANPRTPILPRVTQRYNLECD